MEMKYCHKPGCEGNPTSIPGQAAKMLCGSCEGGVTACGACRFREHLLILKIYAQKGGELKQAALEAHKSVDKTIKSINSDYDARYGNNERHSSDLIDNNRERRTR